MSIDYSIIIPAFNEEDYLKTTINRLKEAMDSVPLLKGEIVVVDNNSSDNTSEIAKNMGVNVVFEAINQISRARNVGAKNAKGRYFIFVDADTIVPPQLLQNAINNLTSEQCCGGGATLMADKAPALVKAVLAYWNAISRTFRLAAGCFVYARRDDFETCGGFSENLYATEEVWFSIAIKRAARKYKRKFKIINQPKVITSGRKLVWFSHSYQLILLLVLFLFPFLMRFKWACGYWYRRPEQKK